MTPQQAEPAQPTASPWPALWALVVGFFMILLDTTIVSVANPAIKAALDPHTANLDNVVWVTSAYLLAYAVPLLLTGRLGDRFGPKRIYLAGLVVFTLSSLLCGLSGTLPLLIAARALHGVGAAMMTPQTMAVITRTFPATQRGAAMGLWGATAGVATLVGPIAGGVLVDGLGWEWIFFINVPVGVVAWFLAVRLVPALPTHPHRFDTVGVLLSGAALFLIVFGLQEGEAYNWGQIWGPISVWGLIIAGLILAVVFVWNQARTRNEPLVPLELFRDRNFAVANIGIAAVGCAVTSMSLPLMFFAQLGRGLTPTQAALITAPSAVLSGVLAPVFGRILDRTDPRYILLPGLAVVLVGLSWWALWMTPDTPILAFLLPATVMGVGQAGMWGPLSTTANRNLPPQMAGAGAGVYNTTRQIGSVIGSAAVAALMQSRLTALMPAGQDGLGEASGGLPAAVAAPFSAAMAQSMLLPIAVLALGLVAACFLERPSVLAKTRH